MEEVLSVHENNQPLVTVFPNPTTQWLNIRVKKKAIYSITISDAMGKSVFRKENVFTNEVGLDVAELFGGVYTITLNGAIQYSCKFVKE